MRNQGLGRCQKHHPLPALAWRSIPHPDRYGNPHFDSLAHTHPNLDNVPDQHVVEGNQDTDEYTGGDAHAVILALTMGLDPEKM